MNIYNSIVKTGFIVKYTDKKFYKVSKINKSVVISLNLTNQLCNIALSH